MADDYLVADTAVVSFLTKHSPHCEAYQALIGDCRLAVSFQTHAELLSCDYGPKRRQRLDELLTVTLLLPHTEATNVRYARVATARSELRRAHRPGEGAQDGDMWIISSAAEHDLPLLSHDDNQVHLGRVVGLRVLTCLDGLRGGNPPLSDTRDLSSGS